MVVKTTKIWQVQPDTYLNEWQKKVQYTHWYFYMVGYSQTHKSTTVYVSERHACLYTQTHTYAHTKKPNQFVRSEAFLCGAAQEPLCCWEPGMLELRRGLSTGGTRGLQATWDSASFCLCCCSSLYVCLSVCVHFKFRTEWETIILVEYREENIKLSTTALNAEVIVMFTYC